MVLSFSLAGSGEPFREVIVSFGKRRSNIAPPLSSGWLWNTRKRATEFYANTGQRGASTLEQLAPPICRLILNRGLYCVAFRRTLTLRHMPA
jgi:hypothetical protein